MLAVWVDRTPELERLYTSVHAPRLPGDERKTLDATFVGDFAQRTERLTSEEGADALGWLAFVMKGTQTSAAWLDKTHVWQPTETDAYGCALAASRLKDRETFARIKAAHPTFARVAALKYRAKTGSTASRKRTRPFAGLSGSLRGRIAKLQKASRWRRCLKLSATLRPPLSSDDYQIRRRCLMKAKRHAEAEVIFAAAVSQGRKAARRCGLWSGAGSPSRRAHQYGDRCCRSARIFSSAAPSTSKRRRNAPVPRLRRATTRARCQC